MNATPSAPTPRHGFATEQIHAGQIVDAGHGARITPIHLSAGFLFDDFEQAEARFAGEDDGYVYTRMGNPTIAAVERKLAALEGGRDAIAVASGQAAATVALLGILQAGDHVVSARNIYEGTRGLLRQNLGRLGIDVDFVDDANDPEAWRRAIRPTTRLLYGESLSNPRNELLDIEAVAGVAHGHGLPLVIDNTLATPYLLRPIEHGADIVVHSTSKFLSGHGAALGGVLIDAGTFDWADGSGFYPHLSSPDPVLGGRSYAEVHGPRAYSVYARGVVASRLGPSLSPLNAFLLQQGLETLSLRVERHSANALTVARWLEGRPEVASVDYSALESSPSHALAERYLPRGHGSVFSFTLAGGQHAAVAVVNTVELISRMTHLGDVRSLILHPGTTSHAQQTPEVRAAAGIHPGTLRLSVGIEDVADVLADLERAFAAIPVAAATRAAAERASATGSAAGVHAHLLHAAAVG